MAKETKEKNSFVFYYDYRQHLALLSDEERGRLIMALLDYGESGQVPELNGAVLMAFSFMRAQIDRDAEKYAKICQKRREAGQRGGRPSEKKDGAEKQNDEGKPSESNANQNKAKKAKGFNEKQSEAKKPDTDTDTDTDTETDTDTDTYIKPNGLILLPPKGGIAPKAPKEAGKAAETAPYKKIVALYHEKCVSFPQLKYISKKRKELMDDRWKDYEQNLDTFRELFEQAENSQYLKGKNKSGWSASFDWLLAEENMPKVLEGNFADKPKNGNGRSSHDMDDWSRALLERQVAAAMEEKKKNPPITAGQDPVLRERMEALQEKLG